MQAGLLLGGSTVAYVVFRLTEKRKSQSLQVIDLDNTNEAQDQAESPTAKDKYLSYLNKFIRIGAATSISAFLMYQPIKLNLPHLSMLTMTTSVSVCVLSIRICQKLIFPQGEGEGEVDSFKLLEGASESSLFKKLFNELKDYFSWICDSFWFLLPIVKIHKVQDEMEEQKLLSKGYNPNQIIICPPNNSSESKPFYSFLFNPLVKRFFISISFGTIKLISLPILYGVLLFFSQLEESPQSSKSSFLFKIKTPMLYTAWTLSTISGLWALDFMDSLLILITKGKYGFIAFNNYFFSSSSISEFWSVRYNQLIRCVLHQSVFIPFQKNLNFSVGSAALASFSVSGLLHSYVAHCTFGKGQIKSFFFFLFHGAAVAFDKFIHNKTKHHNNKSLLIYVKVFRRVFVPLVFILTSRLYISLFIDSMPAYLAANPLQLPLQLNNLVERTQKVLQSLDVSKSVSI